MLKYKEWNDMTPHEKADMLKSNVRDLATDTAAIANAVKQLSDRFAVVEKNIEEFRAEFS